MPDHRFKNKRSNSVVYGSQGKALYIPDERTPLLVLDDSYNDIEERELLKDNNIQTNSDSSINSTWEEAIAKGLIKTNFAFETKSLINSSWPMIITFLLQNSFSLASIYSVGHLGKAPLAGITLGSMTANITGFAAIQGLTTCLDTLCSQAYGAGKYGLVGLNFIRCSMFAITCFIPIGFIWFGFADQVLHLFVKDYDLCLIAFHYLRIVCFGVPGFILFECGKRFLQSQGCFHASTYVLVICAPLNVFFNWLLVWKLGMGYIGAPIAITLNYWLMPLGLLVFTLFNKSFLKCWPENFTYPQVFQNWSKMIELALPGIIMVEAEFLGFEIITLMASNLGTAELAAQSVISSICALFYQIPFSVSIATATRVANYIGASLADNAKISCKASITIGLCIGLMNSFIVYTYREFIVSFFTNDKDVIQLASNTICIISYMEIVDCLNACSAGCLRGQGLQRIGGFINIFSFYVVGIPISYTLSFKYGLEIKGLWIGIVCGLTVISLLQGFFVFTSNWDNIVDDAKKRNDETV